jgi:hypothetical protein
LHQYVFNPLKITAIIQCGSVRTESIAVSSA